MAEPYIPAIKDFDFLFKFLFAYFFIQVWGILTGQGRTFEKVPEINRKQIKDIEKKIKKVSETIRNKRQKLQKLQNTKNDDDVDETEEGGQVQAPWKQGGAGVAEGWGYGLAGGGGGGDSECDPPCSTGDASLCCQIENLVNKRNNLINQKHELGKSKRAKLVVDRKVTEEENLSTQRKYLFQFVFLTVSMFIFAFALIGFLEVPGRDVANIAIFIFITASLLKYLFDFSILENGQSYMIILAALSLYVDSFRETAERIASQF